MKTVFYVALAIHILSILGILGLLLSQAQKSPRKLNPGIIHAGLTALVAGIVMTSIFKDAHPATATEPAETLNHMKVGIKSLVLTGILFLGYRNVKKPSVNTWVWGTMLGLTVFNILIALGWK